jgi:hypothetical protein
MEKITQAEVAEITWNTAKDFIKNLDGTIDLLKIPEMDRDLLKRELVYLWYFITDYSIHTANIDGTFKKSLRDFFTNTYFSRFIPVASGTDAREEVAKRAPVYGQALQAHIEALRNGSTPFFPVGRAFSQLIGKENNLQIMMEIEAVFNAQALCVPRILHEIQQHAKIV